MALLRSPEIVIDLDLPAQLPSRYRARLESVTRLEARIRFLFSPRVFRSGEVGGCGAEILLVLGRQCIRLEGNLEPDRSGAGGQVRFTAPIALPDYALLRKSCGLDDPPKNPAAETVSLVEEVSDEFSRDEESIPSAARTAS